MFKNKGFEFFKRFFENQIREMVYQERLKLIKERDAQKQKSELIEYELFLGKPVIAISNEWETPIIGFAENIKFITQGHCPVLIIYDLVTNREVLVFSKVFVYTEQRLNAIFKLDPFELCSLIYNYQDEFSKEIRGVRMNLSEVQTALKTNGFYERLDHYLNRNKDKVVL